MNFEMFSTNIPEIKIIKGARFRDSRGFFSELYKSSDFNDLGMPGFVQDNLSKSLKGVIRGMHWQEAPFEQGKLVHCISGSIIDIAIDVRPTSSTYGKHVEVELSENDSSFLWIPPGFAHGFQSLLDDTIVLYKVTQYWNQKSERSLNPLDNNLNLGWKDLPPLLSDKDLNAPSFNFPDCK